MSLLKRAQKCKGSNIDPHVTGGPWESTIFVESMHLDKPSQSLSTVNTDIFAGSRRRAYFASGTPKRVQISLRDLPQARAPRWTPRPRRPTSLRRPPPARPAPPPRAPNGCAGVPGPPPSRPPPALRRPPPPGWLRPCYSHVCAMAQLHKAGAGTVRQCFTHACCHGEDGDCWSLGDPFGGVQHPPPPAKSHFGASHAHRFCRGPLFSPVAPLPGLLHRSGCLVLCGASGPAAPAAPPAAAQPHPAAHARPFAPRPCGAGPYGTDGLRGTSPAGGPAGGELAEPSLGMSSEPCIDGVPVQVCRRSTTDCPEVLIAAGNSQNSLPVDLVAGVFQKCIGTRWPPKVQTDCCSFRFSHCYPFLDLPVYAFVAIYRLNDVDVIVH